MNNASYYLLDVFTERKYGGNQLAIFPDARFIDPSLFQKIARELNLSETVFLFPPETGNTYSMRIFTPGQELPTAGHPTVGTGYYLSRELNHGATTTNSITLNQKIGQIKVEVSYVNNLPDLVTMYQPLPEFGPVYTFKKQIAEALSLDAGDIADFPIQEISCGNNILIVGVNNTAALAKIKFRFDLWESLKPQFEALQLYLFTINGVEDGDVQGRMFAPDLGILEDPATGSANGPLICYFHKHNIFSKPIKSLQGYEMGRPSQLYLDVSKNEKGEITEVKVGGKCVYVGKGTLFLDI